MHPPFMLASGKKPNLYFLILTLVEKSDDDFFQDLVLNKKKPFSFIT